MGFLLNRTTFAWSWSIWRGSVDPSCFGQSSILISQFLLLPSYCKQVSAFLWIRRWNSWAQGIPGQGAQRPLSYWKIHSIIHCSPNCRRNGLPTRQSHYPQGPKGRQYFAQFQLECESSRLWAVPSARYTAFRGRLPGWDTRVYGPVSFLNYLVTVVDITKDYPNGEGGGNIQAQKCNSCPV